ncbi:helix-turn-helix domain-containing protein [Vibrio splendidus]|nr:helix-turn-helix domain-containing protein [Vibrio splendidus]MCC4883308.1 helix-turn-helix domain-containing protein [Vibrio splendidus]
MTVTSHVCPKCIGKKEGVSFSNTGANSAEHYAMTYQCSLCDGTGQVSSDTHDNHIKAKDLGKKLRSIRVSQSKSLKEFAKMLGIGISELSRAELGVFKEDKHIAIGNILYDIEINREVEVIDINGNGHYPICKIVGSDATYTARSNTLKSPFASALGQTKLCSKSNDVSHPVWELKEKATHWSIQCNALVKAAHGCVLQLSKYNANRWLLVGHLENELNDTTKFIARPMRGEEL